jgi:hypothetical protein
MTPRVTRGKRGRPPKFGRPGRVVALTLPAEVVLGLRKVNADLAWAIVTLFEKTAKTGRVSPRPSNEAELVAVRATRSLIVVPRQLFTSLNLPGVSIIPLHDDRAFLALEPGRGMSDLVLAVDDRLAEASLDRPKAAALRRLRTQLRQWRSDPRLRCEARSIIVVERRRSRRPA